MTKLTRRKFIEMASSLGAVLAWRSSGIGASEVQSRERREFYPQGVASGDPHPDSVILWTRRPPLQSSTARKLIVEVAEDSEFHRVVARTETNLSAETDWTCRVLAAGLKPRREYWYRFTDEHGFGSRVGRNHRAFRFGCPSNDFLLRELSERATGSFNCVSTDDLRRRAQDAR